VNEFREFGDRFDEVGGNELADPAGGFLSELGLQFYFEDGVGETANVGVGELVEGVVDANVGAAPVVTRALLAVPIVFADQREFRVEGDSNSCVPGELEGRTIIKGADRLKSVWGVLGGRTRF
jgi:hypothetical protein